MTKKNLTKTYTFLFAITIVALISPEKITASPVPTYKTVAKRLPVLWGTRYPVKVYRFTSNPEKLGFLSVTHKKHKVYYYHFKALVYRPLRGADKKIKYDKKLRKIELWVRYRPWLKAPYDLSFARRDLLPGKYRRWIK